MIDNRANRELTLGLDWAITTDAVTYPVTLTEVKNFLRVDYSNDDDLINSIIKSATVQAEKYLNRSITEKTVEFVYNSFSNSILLPYPPYQTISQVEVIYRGTTTILVEGEDYYLHGVNDKTIYFNKTYRYHQLKITATVGYTTVPEIIKQAILKLTARQYEFREDFITGGGSSSIKDLEESFKLLNAYKIHII